MDEGHVTPDAPPRVCGEDLVALLNCDGGGELGGRAEEDASSATRDSAPPFVGEDVVALLKSAGLGGGEMAEREGLISGSLKGEMGHAGTRDDAAPLVVGEDGEHLVALDNDSTGLGGGETAHHGPLINVAPEAEDRRWIRGARVILLRAADASSRVLSWIAREPLFLGVARFVPLAEETAVTLAAATYLTANPATHQELVLAAAHQVRPLRWWLRGVLHRAAAAASRLLFYMASDPFVVCVAVFLPGSEELIVATAAAAYLYATGRGAEHHHRRGAWLLLPSVPAAAYLLAPGFTDAPLLLVASVLLLVSVAALAALPRD